MTDYFPIDSYFDSGSLTNTGTLDNPSFNLVPAVRNAEGMSIVSVNIPFSYNVIDALSNKLFITILGGTQSGKVYTVYIPCGTYTDSQFVTVFNSTLGTTFDPASPWDGGVLLPSGGALIDLTGTAANQLGLVCYSYTLTSKFTFYSSATTSLNFSMDFTDPYAITSVIGVRSAVYPAQQGVILLANNTETASVYYVEPPFTYQLTGPGFIYIYSDLAQAVQDGAVRTELTTNSILWGVNAVANYKGYHTYLNPHTFRIPFSRTTVNRANFYLLMGQKLSYCPGSDYTYYNGSTPIITNFLQLMGQPFQIVIRFWYKLDTSLDYFMRNGDKFIHTESQHTSNGKPSGEEYNRKDIKPNSRERLSVQIKKNGGITSSHAPPPYRPLHEKHFNKK